MKGFEDLKWKLKLIHNNIALSLDCVKIKKCVIVFRWFIPVVCDYNITIDEVGKFMYN